jgi:iron complex transport system permease protein
MALIGGFGLGAAGFVYQTVFRNPLASPDIIGVSSGASVGAAFAILFVSSGALSTTVCAFAGGLAAVFLSLGLAAAAPGRSKMSLVLAGIAVHALAQTLLMLLKLTADPEKELASIEYWIMGSGRRDPQPGVVPGAGRAGLLRGDLCAAPAGAAALD